MNLQSNANTAVSSNPNIQFVTSWNLKRLVVTEEPTHLKLIASGASYRELQIMGMRLGVTWDEIVRGLIEREMSSVTPGDGLADFIPVLQVS